MEENPSSTSGDGNGNGNSNGNGNGSGNLSSSSSSLGRVVRIHLACIAPLPLGSSLRVTGAHLWDPAECPGHAHDPSNAKCILKTAGREAYASGAENDARSSDSSTAVAAELLGVAIGGGGDGVEATAQTNGNGGKAKQPVENDVTRNDSQHRQYRDVMMGVRDSRSRWYASSVEMVTCPETYPLWRTRRPVIVALTDTTTANNTSTTENATSIGENDGMESTLAEEGAASDDRSGIHHHRYRYLVVTPGAEHESSHGLMGNVGDDDYYPDNTDDQKMTDIQDLFHKTKISSGNLIQHSVSAEKMDNAMTSNDYGSSFPVTLWENPFLATTTPTTTNNGAEEDAMMDDAAASREVSISALSIYSEATSTRQYYGGRENSGGNARDFDLVNLPFRTLDIDIATASVIKGSNEQQIFPKYTDDGVLIDTWNDCNDVTFQSYRALEGIYARHGSSEEVQDLDIASSLSEGGNSMTMAIETAKLSQRIIIVCFHLPVSVSKDPDSGEWHASWAESLLAKTENSSFVSAYNPHWVGTVTTDVIINDNDKQALRKILAAMDCTVLFFDDDVRDAHYKGFCKQVLWLAFHHIDLLDMRDSAFSMDLDAASTNHLQSDKTLLDLRSSWDQRTFSHWWEAFKFVNHTFAEEVAKMVTPEDVIWVHDYHLSLLPKLLGDEERKAKAPRLTKKIFFLHIPFPVSMIFKELECGPAILEGLLNADVVGFHGFTDARHFLSSAKRILGVSHENLVGGLIGVQYKKRIVAVTMSSVSIEPAMVDAAMRLSSTIAGEAELRSKHAGRMIIAGLDPAQYLSGVGLKLSAYEMLLRDSPTWRDRVVLVQRCLIPDARRLDEANTVREIRTLVNQIKSKYGDAVIDYEEVFGYTLPVDQRLALWRASDCLLNTEVRCGLNLWPLEFVFAQQGLDFPGIVISSEFSAVFGILNGALRINPFDTKLTLATIDKALTMSKDEREGRHLRDVEFVSSNSSAQWIKNILRDLKELIDDHNNEESKDKPSDIPNMVEFLSSERDDQFTCLDPNSVISAYEKTSRRVIILDFNGTIVIKEDVDSYLKRDDIGSTGGAPPQAVCESLAKLAADPRNTVFVVSGDNNENLEKAIGTIPGIGLAASNGSCFSPPVTHEGARTWLAFDLGVDWDSVKRVALPIMSKFTARTNGSFIKIAHSSVGWSYYSSDPEFGSLQAKHLVLELERELASFDVRFVNLKGIVEVIPRRLNKGIIVKKILRDIAARDNNAGVDFILCMGDDVSDEKMFSSVFSFISEFDDDYSELNPSPPVIQLSQGAMPAPQSFIMETTSARSKNTIEPMFAFTVAVGKKPSHALQYVDSAEDVADLLVKLANGSIDACFERGRNTSRFEIKSLILA